MVERVREISTNRVAGHGNETSIHCRVVHLRKGVKADMAYGVLAYGDGWK